MGKKHNDNQQDVTLSLTVQGYDDTLDVRELSGSEALCELYELTMRIVSSDTALPISSLVGAAAELVIQHGDDTSRTIHGVIYRLQQGRTSSQQATYHAVLVPWAWRLTQRTDSRVFQKTDVTTILTTVLQEHGMAESDYVLPSGSYQTRDRIVQYRETDWDFLCRLMEREGIYYYFEQSSEGCTLVMTDDGSTHQPLDPAALEYDEDANALEGDEAVTQLTYTREARSEQITTWTVAFEQPHLTTVATASLGDGSSFIEQFDPQPRQSAQHQLEAAQAGAVVASGSATTVRLAPGSTFTLSDHPRDDFDGEYLITRVRHEADWDQGQLGYTAYFECIASDVTYRPTQKTAKPRIVGPQAATVLGREGVEIDTDAYGRVLVRMHWDRNTDNSLTSSASGSYELWVHVAQMASASYGSMFIPRAGSYVLVEFIDGDPDEPVITGRIYNDVSQPPYSLPANATKSTIRSKIHGADGEYSELTFDDASDTKQLYMRAQRSLKLDVGTTETDTGVVYRQINVHGSDSETVDVDQTVNVVGKRLLVVGEEAGSSSAAATHDVQVHGDQQVTVSGSETQTVGGSRTTTVVADDSTTVTGTQTLQVADAQTVTLATSRTLTVGDGGSEDEIDTVTVNGSASQTVNGDQQIAVSGSRNVDVGSNLTQLVAGDTSLTSGTMAVSTTAGGLTITTSGGELTLDAEDDATKIGGNTIYLSADSHIEIRSATSVSLVVGSLTDGDSWERKITLDEDGIYISNDDVHEKLDGSTVKINC